MKLRLVEYETSDFVTTRCYRIERYDNVIKKWFRLETTKDYYNKTEAELIFDRFSVKPIKTVAILKEIEI